MYLFEPQTGQLFVDNCLVISNMINLCVYQIIGNKPWQKFSLTTIQFSFSDKNHFSHQ